MTFLNYFNSTQTNTVLASAEAVENSDREFILLSRISSHLAKFNFLLQCGEDRFYSAEYLSHVARFTAATLVSLPQLTKGCAQRRWLMGDLPIAYIPQIELTPQEALQYLPRALRLCRDQQAQALLDEYSECANDLRDRLLA